MNEEYFKRNKLTVRNRLVMNIAKKSLISILDAVTNTDELTLFIHAHKDAITLPRQKNIINYLK